MTPRISIVTPVYNAERFIRTAYESLLRQTFTDWEWVVVNDGSTDHSGKLLQQLAQDDHRIRYYEQKASGSAKQPRDHAVYEANSDWLLMFDIDDIYEEDTYIEQMWERRNTTDAQIVYPHMVFVDETTRKRTLTLPTTDIDTKKVHLGRTLVKATIPDWHIGCAGGLYHKSVWVNNCWTSTVADIYTNSDEVDERLYLLAAERVAFSTVHYLYIQHPASVTHRLSLSKFDPLKADAELHQVILQQYGEDSEEYRRMQHKIFNTFRSLLAEFIHYGNTLSDVREPIIRQLRQNYALLRPKYFSIYDRFRFFDFHSYQLTYLLFRLKYCIVKP